MKIITPENNIVPSSRDVTVFLAGGITGCENWQNEVISKLMELSEYYSLGRMAIYNPRCEAFDINDCSAEIDQIKWERNRLKTCDIFSAFFQASESLQPISLYELGKNSVRRDPTTCVVTVQKGYKRERDVLIQCALERIPVNYISGEEAIEVHARSIANAVNYYGR